MAKHCEKAFLCKWTRPCGCRCKSCKKMPMTDTRPLPDRQDPQKERDHVTR